MKDELLKSAFAEDFAELGDVTGEAIFSDEIDEFMLISKDEGILCGIDEFCGVFTSVDPSLQIRTYFKDSDRLSKGDLIAEISGKVASILKAERTALNILSHLSGIASKTAKFVEASEGKAIILDTRKTTPTLRTFEKYSVVCGGGTNHRYGLFDRVLIKDNHLAHWTREGGTLAGAITQSRKKHPDLLVEVEVDTMDQLKEVLPAKPDWVLLDNMPPLKLRECVKLCEGICKTEASGGVNLSTIREIAKTGVDAVSVGALTHSAPSADLALDFV